MKLLKATLVSAIIFAATSTGGCHDRAASEVVSNKIVTKNKDTKPGAAIKLISDSTVFINVNEIKQLELLLASQEAKGILSLELSSTNGLELLDTRLQQMHHLDSRSSIVIPVKIRALENGRYYVNIRANVDNGDLVSSRNLALIVQVGELSTVADDKSLQLKKPAGENLIVLPAQETISNQ